MPVQTNKKIAIIGAGISGLASAVRLAKAGFEVDVFEKAGNVGGKMNEIHHKGYRFDTGPSLFTLPELLTELYDLCETPANKRLKVLKPEISCRYFYPDTTVINAWQEPEKFAHEVEAKTGEPAIHVLRFLKHSQKLYELTAPLFIFQPLVSLKTLCSRNALKVLMHLHLLSPLQQMAGKNRKWFRSPKVQQLFNRFATYNGSNPYKAPATLNIIPHLEHNLGAYFASGGMYRVAQSLYQLAKDQGARFTFNTAVERIQLTNNGASALIVNGQSTHYDAVVSDVDVFTLYKHLLPRVKMPARYKKRELSSSALIFYWGINRPFPQLDLHNILFAKAYREEFTAIFENKTIHPDPTVYIYISAKENALDAPANCENWFVMINAPHNAGQNWPALREKARKHVVNKINQSLNVSIEDHIVFEEYLDPVRIEAKTNSYRGALYGPGSNSKMAAFLRHPNTTHRIKNLYFTGGSVHPGGGVPLCMASAKIVAHQLTKTLRKS